MAMLLVVATTEATDPTRDSQPFRTAANVASALSLGYRGETRGVASEVRAGQVVDHVSKTEADHQTNGTSGPHHQEKEVNNHGC